MPRSSFDGEVDDFFDACDDIRISTEASSSLSCSTSDRASASWRSDYDLWASEPMSVDERRQRFLKGMGFAEPVPTGTDFLHWQEQDSADCSFHDLKGRVDSTCSSFHSAFSDDFSAPDHGAYCLTNLDTGKRFIAHESQNNGLLTESNKMRTSNKFESLFGCFPLVQKFLFKGNGHSPARGIKTACSGPEKNFNSSWGSLIRKKSSDRICKQQVLVKNLMSSTLSRTKVYQQNKKWMDFSAVYMCQEIQAHKGSIRVMKFSPSGWYLATGGEDSVLRIWMIKEVESSPNLYGRDMPLKHMNNNRVLKKKLGKGQSHALAIIPNKVFSITETPLHEFHGHASDILDMTWSKSNFLLTSSKDKTVRMWKVGCDGCLAVFKHNDYVTCVEFNPVDERYFISGSIDGKVRVWDVSEKRVVDWADVRDVITAMSYKPDGKGFVVGTVAGTCRFYDQSGQNMQMSKLMQVKTKKKSAANQITGLEIARCDSSRVIITSADSKIRVSEGVDIIQKFEGHRNSKILLSPSLTSDGRYLVSAGMDSNVHIWNSDTILGRKITKGSKSIQSCELFFSEGVTTVAPWEGRRHEGSNFCPSSCERAAAQAPTVCHDRECCSFGTWFFADGMRGLATWPEENLLPPLKYINCTGLDDCRSKVLAAWNLVIVTGNRDGVIRSFHNYGLPLRLSLSRTKLWTS